MTALGATLKQKLRRGTSGLLVALTGGLLTRGILLTVTAFADDGEGLAGALIFLAIQVVVFTLAISWYRQSGRPSRSD